MLWKKKNNMEISELAFGLIVKRQDGVVSTRSRVYDPDTEKLLGAWSSIKLTDNRELYGEAAAAEDPRASASELIKKAMAQALDYQSLQTLADLRRFLAADAGATGKAAIKADKPALRKVAG